MLAPVLAVVLAVVAWVGSAQAAAADPAARTRSWGDNAFGQLGDATAVDRHTPVTVAGLTGAEVRAVSAGGGSLAAAEPVIGGHGLARLASGRVEAWGLNNHGQLGEGTTVNHSTPGVVPGLATVRAVSAGGVHSLALLSSGTVKAWGSDADGQLGNDAALVDSAVPVDVASLTGVKAVSAGGDHSLALLNDGTVWAWGDDDNGQLGNDAALVDSAVPVQVTGLTDVTGISAGADHSLAVRSDGTVWSWGDDDNGQLGNDAALTDSAVPVQVAGLTNIRAVSAGGNHSLALVVPPAGRTAGPVPGTGTVKSWGDNELGQLGNNNAPTDSAVPVDVLNQTNVRAVSAGFDHSLALVAAPAGPGAPGAGAPAAVGGTVRAWGSNDQGELGDGTTTDRATPITVQTAIRPTSLDAGSSFSLAS